MVTAREEDAVILALRLANFGIMPDRELMAALPNEALRTEMEGAALDRPDSLHLRLKMRDLDVWIVKTETHIEVFIISKTFALVDSATFALDTKLADWLEWCEMREGW